LQFDAGQAVVVGAGEADQMCRKATCGVVPVPVGLDAYAVDSCGGATLPGVGAGFEFDEAGIFAFGYEFAYLVSADVEYRLKQFRQGRRVFYESWFGEDRLDLIACGEDSAATIENGASLGLFKAVFLLLS